MKSLYFLLVSSLLLNMAYAQNGKSEQELPFRQIPEYPEAYTEATIAARLVDALGFRYYWATEGLTEEDLAYRPTDEARSLGETLDHVLGLAETIANAPQAKPNIRPANQPEMTWEAKRKATLEHIQLASALLKAAQPGDMDQYAVIFQRGDKTSEFPFWNMINGPIVDAIYHVGQVVSFRRSAGNPIHPGVNVFMGTVRE